MPPEQSPATIGKVDAALFARAIHPRLGRQDASVRVGPAQGVDSGIIDLGRGQVMALTTDPFFVMPEHGWRPAGWFAVHILASDLATTGLAPRYMSVDLNLPPDFTDASLAALWEAVHDACDELGISVVTGHTGRYAGCQFPMVGGCTMVGIGPADAYVTSAMARAGDHVLMTKGAAVEATALMAWSFPERLRAAVGPTLLSQAQEMYWQMSTVRDALTAAAVGVRDAGVTAMHDATERGVLGGLYEIAQASGVGLRIDAESIHVCDAAAAVCAHFGMDPLAAISEGTLLLTCRPHARGAVREALQSAGVPAYEIGVCTQARDRTLVWRDGEAPLTEPGGEPFWSAFQQAAAACSENT